MPQRDSISTSEAAQYDEQCLQMEWHGHEALFGMMYEYLLPGQTVLDLGTGTGLMAALFHKAGLEVYGNDISEEMLEACRRKDVARELAVVDISQPGWPYANKSFGHLTACGVFHFLADKDLDVVFGEARRVLKAEGTFGFTVKGVFGGQTEYLDREYGIRIYCMSEASVEALAARHRFRVLKKMPYWTYNDPERKERSVFYLYVTQKMP
jgi:ubiquinone/menaquinone biosynthesis C-methylase UbiE